MADEGPWAKYQQAPEGPWTKYQLADPNTGQPIAKVEGGLNSPAGDFAYGAAAPAAQFNRLMARGFAAVAPGFLQERATQDAAQADKAAQDLQATYTQDWRQGAPPAFSPARIAGEVAVTAPLAYGMPGAGAGSLMARLASGLATGAATGALQPVDTTKTPNYAGEVLKNTAEGGAIGGVVPGLAGALARVIRPNTSENVAALIDRGVAPTPGQIMGGTTNRLEQALTSVPVIGDLIKSSRYRAVDQFNRGAINDVLTPIGETLESKNIGRDAIVEMGDKVSRAYERAIPDAGGRMDEQAIQAIADLRRLAQEMPADRAQQFDAILRRTVIDRISPNGSLTGQSFKDAESDLGKAARDYLHNRNSTADERQLGGAVRQTQSILRDWLARANPESAAEIQAANDAYARMLRVENAAARQGEDPGVFSPAQLQAAIKKYSTDRQYARGQGLMQPYADAGRAVLGATVPDSGTALRGMAGLGLSALAGHGAGIPSEYIAPVLGAGGAAAGIYNPATQRAMAYLLAQRPSWADPVANAIRGAGPFGSAAAVPFALAP